MTPQVRLTVRSALSAEAFRPKPFRALWFLPLLLVICALTFVAAIAEFRLALPASVAAGVFYGSLFFLGHEVMHGAMVRSHILRYVLGWACFQIFLLSPHLWMIWHVRLHHSHTNVIGRDPDIYGTLGDFERMPLRSFVMASAPGSGRMISFLFPFLWFFGQSQGILWSTSRRVEGFERLNRNRAFGETFLMLAMWGTLFGAVGVAKFILVFLVPFLIANAVVMSYVMTNHMAAPLRKGNADLLGSTWSIVSPRWADRLFFYFSHHAEHHLFPSAPSSSYPQIREVLVQSYGDSYVRLSHVKAIKLVYATPRSYSEDGQSLVDPASGHTVELPLNVHARG